MEVRNNPNGIVDVPAYLSVTEILDRLETILQAKGVTIFARIDQQKAAATVGLLLRPTELLLFGNPKAGTLVMHASPGAALDLPLKVVAWQDDNGQVWLSYNDTAYLQERHKLSDELAKNIAVVPTLVQAALAS